MSEKTKKGLSTKDVKTGGLPKTVEPGERILKINNVHLKQFDFMKEEGSYFLILDVETKPIPGFEGFLIDKDDPAKGCYKGQIGSVKTNQYSYKDGETKSGVKTDRNLDILRMIKSICIATGCLAWFDKADGKYETIEEFVEAFSKDAPFAGKYLKFCIAGKEYVNKTNGYINYDLHLPKWQKGRVLFEAENATPSKLVKFNPDDHIIKQTIKSTAEFGEDDDTGIDELPIDDENNLGTPPEFEL